MVSLRKGLRKVALLMMVILITMSVVVANFTIRLGEQLNTETKSINISNSVSELLLLNVEIANHSQQPYIKEQWQRKVSQTLKLCDDLTIINHDDGALIEKLKAVLEDANVYAEVYFNDKTLSRAQKQRTLFIISTELVRATSLSTSLSKIATSEMFSSTQNIERLLMALFAFFFLVAILAVRAGKRLISDPVDRIVAHLQDINAGKLDFKVPNVATEEFRVIAETIHNTVEQLNDVLVSKKHLQEENQARRIAEEQAVKTLAILKQTQERMIHAEKLSALGTFVGGVAHEMNNPLMGILNYVSFVSERIEDPKLKEILGRATHEIERITRIVRNMLIYARSNPNAGGTAHVVEVVGRVASVLEARATKEGVSLELDMPDDLPAVAISDDALQQVLMNLVVNAFDAIVDQEYKLVTVRVQCLSDFIEVHVQDSGLGVSDQLRTKVFDAFFTTKPPGKGTGLGLSVSSQLLMEADGELSILPHESGKGAEFVVRLKTVQNPNSKDN